MDLIVGSDNYEMEGPLPDIWFALQVDHVGVYTIWIIFVSGNTKLLYILPFALRLRRVQE